MSSSSRRALFWAPRALCIAFIAFVSMFALDVFGAGYGFWRTLGALAMHLIPTFVMVAALAAAWRWEWIGTVVRGCIYVHRPWTVVGQNDVYRALPRHRLPVPVELAEAGRTPRQTRELTGP